MNQKLQFVLILALCTAVSTGACAQSTGQSVSDPDPADPVSSAAEPVSFSPSSETPSRILPPWDATALVDCEYFLLFHYALTTDGASAEDAAARLKDAFDKDAVGLVRSMAMQTQDNQKQLAALLAYGKSYFDVPAFKEELNAMKEKCDDQAERGVIVHILSECERFH